jgi:hypothetical protein
MDAWNVAAPNSRTPRHGCHDDRRAGESLFAAGDTAALALQILDSQVDVETIGIRGRHDAIEVRGDITYRGGVQFI